MSQFTDDDGPILVNNINEKKEEKPEEEDPIVYEDDVDHYDQYRIPVGIEHIREEIKNDTVRILDAGSGTGNYIIALLMHEQQKQGKKKEYQIIGLEKNMGMIKRSIEKIMANNLNSVIVHGDLLDENLIFEDESFDGIMINQVLDYLDDGSDKTFPNFKKMLNELSRILQPGGFLAINCSTPEQAEGFWYNYMIPEMKTQFKNRHIPMELLLSYLEEDFIVKKNVKVVESLYPEEQYNDVAKALNPKWKKGDCNWTYAKKASIREFNKHLEECLREQSTEALFQTLDRQRNEIGQSTMIIAYRKE